MHLIAWGDSLTAGGDWMSQLDDLGYAWTWEDHGKNFETSWNGEARFLAWLQGETAGPDDVIVLMWGTNDVRASWQPSYSIDALTAMSDAAQQAGYPVVIALPPPFTASPEGHSAAQVATYNANLEQLGQGLSELGDARADVYAHWQDLPGFPDLSYYERADGSSDGVHPGVAASLSGSPGRLHVAEPIAEAIELPEPGGASLLLGALLLGALARRRRERPGA